MNGERTLPNKVPLEEIFKPELLEYAQDISFPWDLDKPLRAVKVGQAFLDNDDATTKWDVPDVKQALTRLSELGLKGVQLDNFPEFIRGASDDDHVLSRERFLGTILILDQASRLLCRGLNERYVYELYEKMAVHFVKSMMQGGAPARLTDWEAAGIDKDQAMIRMLTIMGSLIHSEDLEDHNMHFRFIQMLREQYEALSHVPDPYRQSHSKDLEDIYLYGRLMESGPPQARGVHMHDFVYWVMRLYTSQYAFVRHFGRSPLRNVAVGRDDAEGEAEWLKATGVQRTEEDEIIRKTIKEDVENGRWRPLSL